MGKPRKVGRVNRYIPNSKADMHYRRRAFLCDKSKIESDDRLIQKEERALELEKVRGMADLNENERSGGKILVHGGMKYGCERCGFTWWMLIEKGLEEFGEDHKPVPFTIGCPICSGFARDISGLVKFPEGGYKELPAGAPYFANINGYDCGVPVTDSLKRMFCKGD